MIKLINPFSKIVEIAKKKNLKKQKRLDNRIGLLLTWGKKYFNQLKKLPHIYRNIPAKVSQIVILIIFLSIFITNLALPASQAQKTKQAFLNHPHDFNNRMNMIEILIANGYFEAAKKELDQVGNPDFLTEKEKSLWQKNYLSWAQNSPQGQKILTRNWQNFLEEHPNYKIGWLYLGYYQLLAGKEKTAQESFQKTKNIDPGLEEEIEELIKNHKDQPVSR